MQFFKGQTILVDDEWIAQTIVFDVCPVKKDNEFSLDCPDPLGYYVDADRDVVSLWAMDALFAAGWVTVKEVADHRADLELQARSHFLQNYNFFAWDIPTAAKKLNTPPERIKLWLSGEFPPKSIQKKMTEIWYKYTYGETMSKAQNI